MKNFDFETSLDMLRYSSLGWSKQSYKQAVPSINELVYSVDEDNIHPNAPHSCNPIESVVLPQVFEI